MKKWLISILLLLVLTTSSYSQMLRPQDVIEGSGITINRYRNTVTIGLDYDDISINLAESFGWIDARNYATLALANTAAYNAGKTLLITGNHTLTANTTFTVYVIAIKGGTFTKASTYTLTFNGGFEGNISQHFIGFLAGNVTFGNGLIDQVRPEWWGDNTTPGTTDMTLEIQSAIQSLYTVYGGKVKLLPTVYLVSDTVSILWSGITLEGSNGTLAFWGSITYGGGSGTVIKAKSDFSLSSPVLRIGSTTVAGNGDGYTYEGITVEKLQFYLNNRASAAIYGSHLSFFRLENIMIDNGTDSTVDHWGIKIDVWGGVEDRPTRQLFFRNLFFFGLKNHIELLGGLTVSNIFQVKMENIRMIGGAGKGISVREWVGQLVIDTAIHQGDAGSTGFHFDGNNCYTIWLKNCDAGDTEAVGGYTINAINQAVVFWESISNTNIATYITMAPKGAAFNRGSVFFTPAMIGSKRVWYKAGAGISNDAHHPLPLENFGTATILNGTASIQIAHGMAATPTIVTLGATHAEVSDAIWSADATNITVTVSGNVTADRTISWWAYIPI